MVKSVLPQGQLRACTSVGRCVSARGAKRAPQCTVRADSFPCAVYTCQIDRVRTGAVQSARVPSSCSMRSIAFQDAGPQVLAWCMPQRLEAKRGRFLARRRVRARVLRQKRQRRAEHVLIS